MKIKELQNILNTQPSVSGNTFFIFLIWGLSWLFAITFLVLGIGLLLESALHYKIFLDFVSRQINLVLDQEQRWKISTSFGIISLVLAFIFVGMIFISKMVLVRNHFIIQIEDWLLSEFKDVKVKTRKTRK
ncbi:hypothetical protein GCM10010992_04190 [Cloacibacterium rupense]|uniref:Uncharacterized protein n=1 Tax=Cloacibacterium rupense TaxID=517423 RepID=A0ABQ2NFA8_9FLAO|nr:hypothetical protein [Cloacibacterium rupense]GGP01912.1 hypothetical protein GCM10010992_04190 [Cloacibacterium rupense]